MHALRNIKTWWFDGYLKVSAIVALSMVAAALYLIGSHLTMMGDVAPGKKLLIQSFAADDVSAQISPNDALAQIARKSLPKSSKLGSTSLSTWFSTESISCPKNQRCTIEIRGLRSGESAFWWIDESAQRVKLLKLSPAEFQSTSLGITISVGDTAKPLRILGYVKPKTSRPIGIYLWDAEDLHEAQNLFERNGGILFGSLVALALFSAVIATMHKDIPFLLLAGWLLLTLRLAAINGGWDLYWLGLTPSISMNLLFARLTLGMYGLLSAAVFLSLFSKTLRNWERAVLLTTAHIFIAILMAAPFVAHNYFLSAFRPIAGISLLVAVVIAAKQIQRSNRDGALLFLSSWLAIAIGASIDIFFSIGLIPERSTSLNLQTAAMAAGFIMAIALANRMKTDRIEKREAERAAILALTKFRENYDKVPVGLFSMRATGEIHTWNPKFQEMFDLIANEKVSWSSLFPDTNFDSNSLDVDQQFECSGQNKTLLRWFEIQIAWRESSFEGTVSEITERKLGAERLEYAAHFDQLTGLRNRNFLIESIEQFLEIPKENRVEDRCLIMVDIDGFHQVVTYFGHTAGDHVLQTVRDRILSVTPASSLVGRLSADTFAIVVNQVEIEAAGEIAERLLKAISDAPFSTSNKSFAIRARAGVVYLNEKSSASLALAACDAALIEGKRRGNGSLVIYKGNDLALLAHEAETALMTKFRESIPFDRMHLVYQPIVSLVSPEKSMSYEALLRLSDSEGKIISPGLFIPALEKNGMMSQIDRWVVREVFNHLETHPSHTQSLTYVSVNLSGASLNDEKFIHEILCLAAEHPKSITKICFEITESVALADMASTSKFVRSAKALGARIALDDFGAGYSSFGYLTAIEADYLKIDGILVKNLQENRTNFAVVQAISNLGAALNMSVVAEWVENEEILTTLLQLNVASGQGWALCKPMLSSEIAKCSSGADFCKNDSIRGLLKLPPLEVQSFEHLTSQVS